MTICHICGKQAEEGQCGWCSCATLKGLVFLMRNAPMGGEPAGDQIDLCSYACVCQAIARFLDHGNFEERKS